MRACEAVCARDFVCVSECESEGESECESERQTERESECEPGCESESESECEAVAGPSVSPGASPSVSPGVRPLRLRGPVRAKLCVRVSACECDCGSGIVPPVAGRFRQKILGGAPRPASRVTLCPRYVPARFLT